MENKKEIGSDKLGFWGVCMLITLGVGAGTSLLFLVKFIFWCIDVIIYLNSVIR